LKVDGLSSSKVEKKKQHIPWNYINYTGLERGRQNMMGFPQEIGFPCIRAVYDTVMNTLLTSLAENKYVYIITVPDIQVNHSQESQQATRKKSSLKKYCKSDPIGCLVVKKLARSVFACNFIPHYMMRTAEDIYDMYIQLRPAGSQTFVYLSPPNCKVQTILPCINLSVDGSGSQI